MDQQRGPSNPGSPLFPDPHDWITGYLMVHSMSTPSYRVAFALWIIIASFFLIGTVVRLLGTSRPFWFAHWSKWALRRRTWRKNAGKKEAERTGKPHRQPTPLPSNSQLLSLVFIFILSMILCFVGPDYLASPRPEGIPDVFPPSQVEQTRQRGFKRAVNRTEVEEYVAYYTINKSWWTVAGRTGNIAFALFPLCILFALKAAPFALFALPYTTQFSFDKLSTLHRWVGRLIYFITVIHVLSWSIQLATTKDPVDGRTSYVYAWLYGPFVWGWVAFVPFTVLMASTFRFFRYNFYESFYAVHIVLVPVTLGTAGMHHPSVAWWCWSALVIWGAERAWRFTWWVWVNGIFQRKIPNAPPREKGLDPVHSRKSSLSTLGLKMDSISEYDVDYDAPLLRKISRVPTKVEALMNPPSSYVPPAGYGLAELMPGKTIRLTVLTPNCRPWAPGQHFILCIPSINKFTSHPFTVGSICDQESSNPAGRLLVFFIRAKAGWTKTLWDTVVALASRDKWHCDGEEPTEGTYPPNRGVLLRTFVEGPFGSVARTDWIEYSSVLLVGGGSGVSFALSVVVYLSLCLSGRASKYLGGQSKPFSRVSRVRFVWLAREFSHISWCASVLRRCMALVPGSALQVDIFVTNVPKDTKPSMPAGDSSKAPRISWAPAKDSLSLNPTGGASMEDVSLESGSRGQGHLAPSNEKDSRRISNLSMMSDVHNNLLMPNPYDGPTEGRYADGGLKGPDYDYEMGMGGPSHFQEDSNYDVLDYTHFDGDLDAALVPAEESFNRRLKQEGALRRKMTRKMTMGMGPEDQEHLWADLGQQVASPTLIVTPGPGQTSTPLPSTQRFDGHSQTLPPGGDVMGKDPRQSAAPSYMQELSKREKRLARPSMTSISSAMSTGSIRDKLMDVSAIQAMLPKTGKGARGEEAALHFSDEELEDMLAMTEYAWPGRPMLDKLLKEEVEQAKGPLVVACCGPTQLSASIRKYVAAQIDPIKIKKGDMTGYITCVTEEFEY